MSVEPVKPRGSRQERQAAETRREILEAARRLFAERGYSATGMGDITAEAGVAVQTIYASVGSKRALLAAMLDHMDEEAGVRDLVGRMGAAKGPREVIRLGVQLTRAFPDRCGDLVAALLLPRRSSPRWPRRWPRDGSATASGRAGWPSASPATALREGPTGRGGRRRPRGHDQPRDLAPAARRARLELRRDQADHDALRPCSGRRAPRGRTCDAHPPRRGGACQSRRGPTGTRCLGFSESWVV